MKFDVKFSSNASLVDYFSQQQFELDSTSPFDPYKHVVTTLNIPTAPVRATLESFSSSVPPWVGSLGFDLMMSASQSQTFREWNVLHQLICFLQRLKLGR